MPTSTSPVSPPPTSTPTRANGYLSQTPPLSAATEARIAYNRLGLGVSSVMRMANWQTKGSAYSRILNELENPSTVLVDDVDMGIRDVEQTAADGRVTRNAVGTLNLMGVPTPQQAGMSQKGESHHHWHMADLRAHHRMAIRPEIGFVERLVLFWTNHFSVAWDKDIVTFGSTGLVERKAVRPHVLGNFADMLKAVIAQPAMISYLDNQMNIGPNSTWGTQRFYNENLGREILERHTVGEGNFSQDDVQAMTRLLTGYFVGEDGLGYWSYVGHEEGDVTLFAGTPKAQTFTQTYFYQGKPMPVGQRPPDLYVQKSAWKSMTDQRQVTAALEYLALLPETARNIAKKLLLHFVTDSPQQADINEIANAYLSSGGDLKKTARALLDLPVTWTRLAWPRVRTPQLHLAAINRALGLTEAQINALSSKTLNDGAFEAFLIPLDHGVWSRKTPDGYPDNHSYWFTDSAIRLRTDLTYEYLSAIEQTGFQLPNAVTLAQNFHSLGGLTTETRNLVNSSAVSDNKARLTNLFLSKDFLRRS